MPLRKKFIYPIKIREFWRNFKFSLHHLVKVYLTLGHEGHGFWLLQQTKIKQRLQIRALSLSLAYYFQKGGGDIDCHKMIVTTNRFAFMLPMVKN